MLREQRRPPERVPMVTSANLAGATFTTKLPPDRISTELVPEVLGVRSQSAADRVGLVDCLVAVVKLSLCLDPEARRCAVPKAEADLLSGDFFQGADPEGLLLYGGDFAPFKRLVDVTLTFPDKLPEAKERGFRIGPLERMQTRCDRQSFGPLHPLKPPRSQLLGTFDEAWLRDRWPYFPADFDHEYFNSAPLQQRMEQLRGNEKLELFGFHPQKVETRLPGIAIRAFAQYARSAGYRFLELALHLDTLHIDLASNSLQLVWRGQLPISSGLAPELTHVFACADRLGAPMAARAARELFAQRLERQPTSDEEVASAAAGVPRRFGIPSPKQHAERERRRRALKSQIALFQSTRRDRPRPEPALERDEVEQLVASAAPLEGRDLTGCDLRDLDLRGRCLDGTILTAADLSRSVLSGASLKAAVLSHAKLPATDLRGCNLEESNLEGADLRSADLGGANLRGVELGRANLQGARLERVNLQRADLAESILDGADLTGADLSEANLSKAHATRCIFRTATLKNTTAFELYAPEAVLDDADATGLRAGECDLRRASLRGLAAKGANLEASILEGACLDRAMFDDATFAHAELQGAQLRKLRARTASFRHAKLAGADLRGADLMQSNFECADLRMADLRGSSLFEVETLDAELDGVRLEGADTSGSKLSHPILGRPTRAGC